MTLSELIKQTRARLRSDSAREVHDAITRPQMIRTPRKVTLPKDAATVTWEQIAVGEIESFIEAVTGSRDKALERIAALNSLQMLAAVRNWKKAKPDKAEDINARTDALVLLYLDAQRKGYDWPLPDHFGKPEKVVESWIDSAGPSLVETECPGTPIPTVEETAALME